MHRWPAVLLCAVMALPALAADLVLDDFDSGVEAWKSDMAYGKVTKTTSSSDAGKSGDALRVDFVHEDGATNHLMFSRPLELDLSAYETVSFDIKGIGERAEIFVFFYDSAGQFSNYGPHGTNGDFHTAYADWHRLTVNLQTDRTVQGRGANLGDVAKIGFFVWSMGPRKGTVWFDNLTASPAEPRMSLGAETISPNADGVCDATDIVLTGPPGSSVSLQVLGPDGALVDQPLADSPTPGCSRPVRWDGRKNGASLPAGIYTLRALFGDPEEELREEVRVVSRDPWPPIRYETEPFFPIGVWFEGAPSMSGCPSDPAGAKGYFDLCFADMRTHGFNAAAVPNCPTHLWETLLQSAGEHGIRICLEIGPLAALVSGAETPTEEEVLATARPIVERLSKYPALLRYQIRDEPPAAMIPNWIMVQRVLAALDPKHPSFSCFCQPDSLAVMVESTVVSETVFDVYPFRGSTPEQTLGGFVPTFDLFKGGVQGKPMWAVLQSFGVPNRVSWRYPTPEELRATTYLSLSEGAKGIFYFIYQYMPKYLHGLVEVKDDALEPRPLYAPTTKLASELGKLAPLMLSLRPADETVQAKGSVRVGHFRDGLGKRVLIVASTDPGKDVSARVSVAGETVWRNAITGETVTAQDGVIELTLAGGNGAVLVGQ